MARGRKPQGERALTGAERQARYRARRIAGTPPARYQHPVDRRLDWRIRAQRWREVIAALVTLQDKFAAWLDTVPGSLRQGATPEALQAILDLNLSEWAGARHRADAAADFGEAHL